MILIFDIETVLEGPFDGFSGPSARTAKEQSLRKEFSDLNLLWVKYAELVYERKVLKETNERYVDSCEISIMIPILEQIRDIEDEMVKAKEEYELLLKLLWDNDDGINL